MHRVESFFSPLQKFLIVAEVTVFANFFGRVQGVGFRMLVLERANLFGVKGWVRNSPQEDLVEACFFGEEKKVQALIESLKSEQSLIRVDRVSVQPASNFEKFKRFEVSY